jgi:hypothetical protein
MNRQARHASADSVPVAVTFAAIGPDFHRVDSHGLARTFSLCAN